MVSSSASSRVIENQPLKRYTRAEYDALVDLGAFEGQRIELVFGQLVQMSPINRPHVQVLHRLQYLLYDRLRDRAQVYGQSPFAASDDSEPEPDILVTELARQSGTDHHPSHAFLIIEVAESSLRYDRGEKALLYGMTDVDEYWVVDIVAREVEVRRDRRDSMWQTIERSGAGASISVHAFPDVVVNVDDIF